MSSTVTVKVQVLRLPLASVAMLVTIVTPTANVLPLGGVLTRLVTLQLSVAVALNVTLLSYVDVCAIGINVDTAANATCRSPTSGCATSTRPCP